MSPDYFVPDEENETNGFAHEVCTQVYIYCYNLIIKSSHCRYYTDIDWPDTHEKYDKGESMRQFKDSSFTSCVSSYLATDPCYRLETAFCSC